MNKAAFANQVMEQANLPSREQAEQGSQIVLSLLSHRLTRQESRDVADQLSKELRQIWNSDTWINNYMSITGHEQLKFRHKEELYALIQNEIDKRQLPVGAEKLAIAVFHTLKEQISDGEIRDIAAQLPEEIEQVWMAA